MSVLRDNATHILDTMAEKFNNHAGLWVHAKNESKMENWLQVELCSILKPLRNGNQSIDIITDKQHNDLNSNNIDILIKYGQNPLSIEILELKIIVIGKSTSSGIKSLLGDYERICALPPGEFQFEGTQAVLPCKGVLFLVFPSNDLGGKRRSLMGENGYLNDIENGLGELPGLGVFDLAGGAWFFQDIEFDGGTPSISGKIYLKFV